MNKNSLTNNVLNAVAWGVFIVLLGAGWLSSIYYQVDTGIYIALGVGFILIALALSGSGLLGYALPLVPTLIVLVGLFIVAEAMQKTANKKPLQA
jgi:CHASE2 domain-containing sensor protein